ncbi:slipin family protein [Humisphaera borealis]|uniref:Slipin family protein n=1 Tax=Humisphaera borealis TaxID=2807512 RepID=A0A7M2WRF8_9BACT|nr:slipin family protein [Humisphaera borealis]QOV88098.1 slipin family protein [Humisphaera borealis]
MSLFHTIRIKQHERGFWFRHGEFQGLVQPGEYTIWFWNRNRDRIEIVSTLTTKFEHPLADVLLARGDVRDALVIVDNADNERALVWRDGRLAHVLGPGRFAFWAVPYRLHVERFDVNTFTLSHPRLQAILGHGEASRWLDGVQVGQTETALLYRDGVLIDSLNPGLHVFWKGTGRVVWKAVDLREQVADVAGQEIITADKVSLRVNLVVTWQVADAVKAVAASADHGQALYREAQLVLRAAVGARTLDAMLSDKETVGAEVRDALARRAETLGLAVRGVGLRDIILPGDMKTLLNQVISAQKEAEANLIRRREETAQVRSQANTAKLLSDNPALLRLREMELLKDVLVSAKATFVFGPGDLAEQVRSLASVEK